MLTKIQFWIAGILTAILFSTGVAYAASWYLPPSIKKGDLIVATSTTQAVRLPTSTAGSVLWMGSNGMPAWTATSTLGIQGGTGLASLNGQTGGTQTFATSTTATGLTQTITSGSDVHTWTLSLTSGYVIPLSASTTEWSGLYNNLYSRLIVSTSSSGTLFYVSTSSPGTLSINYPANVLSTTTAAATYEPILTKGNLTATSPLQFDNTRQVIGGAAAISVASGYAIPTTASSTGWDTAHALRHAAVTLAGENYLSISGQQITAGAITLSGSNVTGVLPIANGGTGTSTAVAASQLLVGNGTSYDYTTLPSCSNSTTSKLLYNSTTRTFSCGTDQSGAGGSTTTITSNIQADGPNFTFATGTMTGLNLNITGSGSTVTFSPVLQAGYVIPLSASTTEWATAYGWGNHAAAGYLTSATAASTYVPFTYASSTFPSFGYGTSTYATIANYPTYTYASSTFPSFSYATTTFPSFSYASSTFPSFSYATTTFPNFSYASSTFPSFSYATNTFVTYGYATNTFATIANYPTYTYASSSYFTLFNTVAGSNIVITTSTALKTIAVSLTPTFTSVNTTDASTTNLTIAGRLYDSYSSAGALGEVLQSTATSTKWVATSTLGISGSLSGGTGGKTALWSSATTLTTGLLLDGTVSGVNATSSTVTFNLQGSSNVTPFVIASSTGHTLLQVHRNGSLSVGTTTNVSTLFVQGTSTLPTLNIFQVASSSGTSYFTVANNGSTTLSSLTAGPVYSTASGSLYTGAASGGSSTYNKSYWPIGPFQGANSTQITGSSNQGVCNYFTQYNTAQTSGAAFYVSVSSGTSTCSGGTCGFQIGIYNSSKTLIAATEVGDSATSTATANIRTPTGTKQLRWLSGSAVSAGKMTLEPGNYWMCYSTDSTAMFVRTWGNVNYMDILQAATIDGGTGDKHGYKGSFSSGNGSSLTLPASWTGTLTASGSGGEDLQVYFYK